MATFDIAPSGGDYTSLNAFLVHASTVSGSVGEISGDWSGGYDSTETATADTNLIIRTKSGDQARHDGKEDASGANYKLTLDPSSNGMLDIPNSGCTVDGLIFVLTGTGSSDECLRAESSAGTTTLINNIFRTASAGSDQDCIYVGNIAHTLNLENDYFINAARCGVHMQNFSGSNTSTANAISCATYICGQDAGAADGGFGAIASGGSTTVVFNAFNCWAVDSPGTDFVRQSAGTVTVASDRCISSDDSLTGPDSPKWGPIHTAVDPTESVTTVAGNPTSGQLGVISLTTPYDLTLFDDATDNVAQENHADATGAGLTIGDYATGDIVGTTRPQNTNYDIGPFEFNASSGETIVAAGASYAWTGTVADLLHNRLTAAAAGSYAWTGGAATLLKDSLVSAESASYAWTGAAATLTHNETAGLVADAASYAWTGQDATLSEIYFSFIATAFVDSTVDVVPHESFGMSADAAAFLWTGQDATLTQLSDRILAADAVSYAWTGSNAGLLVDIGLQATAAAWLWVGQDATLIVPTNQDITSTDTLQKPIDFVMADTPPVIPIPAARPGPLRGPRLVDRIHIKT